MIDTIFLMSRLAEMSYVHPSKVQSYLRKHVEQLPVFTKKPVYHKDAFMSLTDKDSLYLAFKGTDSKIDLAQNSLFYQSNFFDKEIFTDSARVYKDAQVHIGLLWKYKYLLEDCDKLVTENSYRDIYLTGHSAGNVCALILVALALRYPSIRWNHFSFGSPPVGNSDFMDLYNVQPIVDSYRITNDQDPVPNLPFLDDSWKHVGKTHLHFGKEYANPDLRDHTMPSYVDAISPFF